MRRQIASFLLGTLSFAWLFVWNVGTVYADVVPCYCRYTDANRLSSTLSKQNCLNEVYMGGKQGTLEDCFAMCAGQGAGPIGLSAVDPEGWGEPYNMVTAEKDHCVFFSGDFPEITGWNSSYLSCQLPLNKIGKLPNEYPEACSFCFCRFRAVAGLNATCVGKTTMVHPTSNPGGCAALCETLKLDYDSSSENYADRCDYRAANGCSAPLNSSGEGCDATLSNASLLKDRVMMRGSVVTLPLPLSNITIPQLVGRVLNALLGIVGALALLMFVWGGFRWMTAAGNTEQAAKAKKTLVWAALGLVAIFGSYAILSFVTNALQ